jgi:hypothetical protein
MESVIDKIRRLRRWQGPPPPSCGRFSKYAAHELTICSWHHARHRSIGRIQHDARGPRKSAITKSRDGVNILQSVGRSDVFPILSSTELWSSRCAAPLSGLQQSTTLRPPAVLHPELEVSYGVVRARITSLGNTDTSPLLLSCAS